MPTYGQTIRWTDFNGDRHAVEVGDCESFESARREAVRLAIECGWTPPRWWQFWRWNDTRPQMEEAE